MRSPAAIDDPLYFDWSKNRVKRSEPFFAENSRKQIDKAQTGLQVIKSTTFKNAIIREFQS